MLPAYSDNRTRILKAAAIHASDCFTEDPEYQAWIKQHPDLENMGVDAYEVFETDRTFGDLESFDAFGNADKLLDQLNSENPPSTSPALAANVAAKQRERNRLKNGTSNLAGTLPDISNASGIMDMDNLIQESTPANNIGPAPQPQPQSQNTATTQQPSAATSMQGAGKPANSNPAGMQPAAPANTQITPVQSNYDSTPDTSFANEQLTSQATGMSYRDKRKQRRAQRQQKNDAFNQQLLNEPVQTTGSTGRSTSSSNFRMDANGKVISGNTAVGIPKTPGRNFGGSSRQVSGYGW